MDFDETRLYYSHQDLQIDNEDDHDETRQGNRPVDDDDDGNVDLQAVRRHFREFLRTSFASISIIIGRERNSTRRCFLSHAQPLACQLSLQFPGRKLPAGIAPVPLPGEVAKDAPPPF